MTLGVVSSIGGVKTISTDDPRILMPCGKRTDQLSVQELREEMKKLPIPNINETSGKMELLHQLTEYVASITKICWPENKETEQC